MGNEITVPYKFNPREYQLPFLIAMDSGIKRAVLVWNRRTGKDKTLINFTIKKMFERVGAYYYFFPSYAQGKKILWDGADKNGFRFLDHFPPQCIKKKNDTEMKIELTNGSIFQIIGTDNIDSVVGTNPVGCVYSEFSLQDPKAWDYTRPILRENGGWAVFNFTPRGKNHAYDLFKMAQGNPEWFCQLLTNNETKVVLPEEIEEERNSGMSEDLIQQEYFCSFDASIVGAYYSDQIQQAEAEGRVTTVPYDSALPVETWWDLGIGDATAIWFTQTLRSEIRVIDYLEADGEAIPYYAGELTKRGYSYKCHHLPHDADVRELSSGKSRRDFLESIGIRPVDIVANIPIEDGINAARMMFNRCWFDAVKCDRGLNALKNYCKDWDEKRKQFRSQPKHDWSSHGSDAFRYLAVGMKTTALTPHRPIIKKFNRGVTGRSIAY